MRHGGDLVVETLAALGVQTVFGVPGQHALALFDGLARSDIRLISSRVEHNAVFSADGYARTTGRPGVVFVSTGPGALTTLSALQEAYASSVPVVVITSQIPSAGLGGRRKGMLHELDDQQASARNVTKAQHTVYTTAQIPAILETAWGTALTAPQGPVWVEIPQDVLLETVPHPAPESLHPNIPQLHPNPGLITQVATLLATAHRPVIIAGGGVRRSGARAETALRHLAELLEAPVVCTQGGNSAFPHHHPLALGSWVEDSHLTGVVDHADVVLAIGTALGEVTSNYSTMQPGGRIIHVDAEPRVLGANYPALGIHADAGHALEQLTSRFIEQPVAKKQWGNHTVTEHVATVRTAIHQRLAAQGLEHELGIMSAIRGATPSAAQTFWDMTIAAYWAWNMWDAQTGSMHSAQGAGGLGYGFPAALGAAIGTGHRTLAVSGDGSALYSIAELATAQQHNAPVTWLIIDDGGYGILREYMTTTFDHTTGTDLPAPDFRALAGSFGVQAFAAETSTLKTVLAQAWESPGPNVVVLPTTMRMWQPTHHTNTLDSPATGADHG